VQLWLAERPVFEHPVEDAMPITSMPVPDQLDFDCFEGAGAN
jgi:hypothetical protein